MSGTPSWAQTLTARRVTTTSWELAVSGRASQLCSWANTWRVRACTRRTGSASPPTFSPGSGQITRSGHGLKVARSLCIVPLSRPAGSCSAASVQTAHAGDWIAEEAGTSGTDGHVSSNKLLDSPAIDVGRPIWSETARNVNELMVITGAPVGSVARSSNASAPVRVRWTCSWVASVAYNVIPLNAYGSRSDASPSPPPSDTDANGCRAASKRAGWMP